MSASPYLPQTRIVAFLDIIGFQAETRRRLQNPELLKALDKSFAVAERMTEGYGGYQTDTRMFSDSICCSSPFEPNNVWRFIYTIEALQMNLVCSGAFVRGGIAIGRHFENRRMIVSDALIDAYLLESKEARFPRIIASEATVREIDEALADAGGDNWDGGRTSVLRDLKAHFRTDIDGKYFLSYLMSLHRIDRSAIVDEYITDHKDAVDAWLADGRARNAPARHREKHEWARDYHNAIIREMFPRGPVEDDLCV